MAMNYMPHTQNRYDYRILAYYLWECRKNETIINRRSLTDFMKRIGREEQTRESNFRHIFTWLVGLGFLVSMSYTNNSFYAVTPFWETIVDILARKYNFENLSMEEVALLANREMERSEVEEIFGGIL